MTRLAATGTRRFDASLRVGSLALGSPSAWIKSGEAQYRFVERSALRALFGVLGREKEPGRLSEKPTELQPRDVAPILRARGPPRRPRGRLHGAQQGQTGPLRAMGSSWSENRSSQNNRVQR